MVSLMFDAVLVMVKAGYPQNAVQKLIFRLRWCGRCRILQWALRIGAVDIVRYLHAERDVDVILKMASSGSVVRTSHGFCMSLYSTTLFGFCSVTSKMPLVKFFVEELGVNPLDRLSFCDGETTALHLACSDNQYETAVYLLEHKGVKVRTKDRWGSDALDCFVGRQGEDAIKLRRYLEERAQSEGSAESFKAYECPCKECVAEEQEQESEDEDDEGGE